MGENTKPRAGVWSVDTRRWVILGLGVAGVWIAYSIREALTPLVIALLLTYLLSPLASWLQPRVRGSRLLAVAIIYLALIAIIVAAFATLIPILFRQIISFATGFDKILLQISTMAKTIPYLDALGIPSDSETLADYLRAELASFTSAAPRLVAGIASGLFGLVFILVLSFYLLKDAARIEQNLDRAIPEEYRDETQRIKTELNDIWSSFLRGQVVLAIIIGTVTTIVLWILGVRNALLLGLLAGLLEVVPNLGPIIAMIPAVVIALFQGSANLPVENTTFAIIVIVAYFLIQQFENHLIVPNVLGSSVNLPAVVILFGAFAGASLAGVLGIFLAAPVLATARLFSGFVFRKLLEPGARN